MTKPLPTENGVYVPEGVNLSDGPVVFVLYKNHWRMSPDHENARKVAQYWNGNTGLRMVR